MNSSIKKLNFTVKPNASATCVTSVDTDTIFCSVQSPPDKDKANRDLIQFIAKTCKVQRSQVSIVTGHRNRNKIVQIFTDLTHEQLISRFEELVDSK